MRGTLRAVSCALTLFLLIPVLGAAAALNDAVVRDFAQLAGYVVQPAGNEFIIDLDARKQIAVGDIFSVVIPGEQIIHPVTKELLGSDDTVKGLLQVSRIKAGYSYCRPVGSGSALQKGDPLRRFQNIDAEFWDYTGNGEPFFRELQAALPHIQWRGYAASQKSRPATVTLPAGNSPALYFILTPQGLEVRSPDFEVIHSYPAASNTQAAALPAVEGSPAVAVTAAAPAVPGIVPAAPRETAMINRAAEPGMGSYWTSPPLKGTPVGVEVGDFDGDGRQEIAVAFFDRLEISRLVKGSYQQLATVSFDGVIRAYHLDGFDLKKNGRMQLFVSAVTGAGNLSSVMVEAVDGQYRITRHKIPWHLRRLNVPGEGAVLIAQKMGTQGREFAGPLFRVGMAGGALVESQVFAVPRKANLYDFAPLPSKEQNLFALLEDDGYLNIVTPDGKVVASSVDKVGGSESHLEMTEEVQSGGESRLAYLPARVEVAENGEILVPVNSGFSLLSRVKLYSKSELRAMVWDGAVLRDSWHSTPEKSYLADFRLADAGNEGRKALVTVVAFPDYKLFSDRTVALHVYRLR